MSKELEDLKRFSYENACCRCQYYIDNKCTNKGECIWLNIENALKDYERRLKLAKEYKDVNNVVKRLKAFEIIKEKNVDISVIRHAIKVAIDNKATLINAKTKEFVEPYIFYNMSRPKNEWLTIEEFDLLKEVLL